MKKKILAIQLRSLGDAVLLTASLAELREHYPDAEIDLVVNSAWVELFESQNFVDRMIPCARPCTKILRFLELLRVLFKLRFSAVLTGGYDLALCFHASTASALLARFSGAKKRAIHFHGFTALNRYSTVSIPNKGRLQPIIERNQDVLRALGLNVKVGRLPRVRSFENQQHWAEEYCNTHALGTPLLILGLGASRPAKNWGAERFAELAVAWASKNTFASVVAVVSYSEQLTADYFEITVQALLEGVPDAENIRKRIRCESKLSLLQLRALMGKSQLFCGNDSGPKHLAVASGLRTITLFGPEDPFEWHPYPQEQHAVFFIPGLSCRKNKGKDGRCWCSVETCEIGHHCMVATEVEPVLQKCVEWGYDHSK